MSSIDKKLEALAAKKKRDGRRDMGDGEKKAKLSALDDLRSHIKDAMDDKLGSLKKVSVASDSQEGLEHGLDKAKDLVAHPDEPHQASEGEDLSDPDDAMEGAEEAFHEDLDHDSEAGEPEAHAQAVLGNSLHEEDDEHHSPEDIDQHIAMLQEKKKAMLKAKKA